MDLSLSADK